MTDNSKLFEQFEAASRRIKDAKSNSGDEAKYAEAYQALVKAGLAMQLKAKYRRI